MKMVGGSGSPDLCHSLGKYSEKLTRLLEMKTTSNRNNHPLNKIKLNKKNNKYKKNNKKVLSYGVCCLFVIDPPTPEVCSGLVTT